MSTPERDLDHYLAEQDRQNAEEAAIDSIMNEVWSMDPNQMFEFVQSVPGFDGFVYAWACKEYDRRLEKALQDKADAERHDDD